MIKYFGDGLLTPLAPGLASDPTKLISQMSIPDIRNAYILYIGAGAVVAGGLISLARSIPTIWHGLKSGLADLRGTHVEEGATLPRTDQDISMKWVIGGILLLILAISVIPSLKMNVLGAILIIIFGFLFVTVSSRLTGEVGSSSNPISGMTVATLLFTCLIFLLLGWTSPDPYFVTALTIGGIVCIASSNGGTTSQDLKTGFLVGSTSRKQQIAILVGALVSAMLLGPLLIYLNDAKSFYKKVEPTAFSAGFQVTEDKLSKSGSGFLSEKVGGKHAGEDKNDYGVWHNTDPANGPVGKYLVTKTGQPAYLVDPGIGGTITDDGEGNKLEPYPAPKPILMSYIIKGILSQELPWGLVLIGAMIAIILEMTGIPSLAFAVGVYLPISTSAPIFVGGAVRWAVDLYLKRKLARQNLTEEQIIAETDKSNGVLIASGYIAGASVAGILVAIFAFQPALEKLQKAFGGWASGDTLAKAQQWVEAGKPAQIEEAGKLVSVNYDWLLNLPHWMQHNPLFAGRFADWMGLIPFWLLALLLYYVGRELVLKGKKNDGL